MNITHEQEDNNSITEESLIKLGFRKEYVDYATSGGHPFSYYCLKLHSYFDLLSSEIIKNEKITVSVLQCGDAIVIKDRDNLAKFIKICRDNIN